MKISKGIKKHTKFVYFAISLLFIFIIFANLWILFKRLTDKNHLESEMKEINDALCTSGPQSSDTSTESEQPNNDYFNYIKIPCESVDIKNLKSINSDTVGFVSISGTNINYPVVQTTDNEFYLRHSFKKTVNRSGWLFMDYRNNSESFGRNTIIYGHNNHDKTMLAGLKEILGEDWVKNPSNGTLKFVNLSGLTNWKIISVYTVPAESYYIRTDFISDEDFKTWLKEISQRSIYSFSHEISRADKIMTFSTCYKDEGNVRLVVHAKKI